MERTTSNLWKQWLGERDARAFAELVHSEIPHALGAAVRVGLKLEDAEDVVQECLTELSRCESNRPIDVGLRPWLIRAARLRARMVLRSSARRRRRERAADHPVRKSTRGVDLRDEVERVLQELSEDDREAVLLRYLHDLPYEDIALVLRITAGAARVRVHRAVARLRGRFGGTVGAIVATLVLPMPHAEAALVSSALAGATAPASTLITGGAIAMKAGTKTVVIAVLLATTGLFLGLGQAAREEKPEPDRSLAGVPDRGELRREVAVLRGRLEELGRAPTTPAPGEDPLPSAETPIRHVAVSAGTDRAELSVRVIDGEGSPVSGKELSFWNASARQTERLTTDLEGRAEVGDLDPGQIEIGFKERGGRRMRFARLKPGFRTEVVLRTSKGTAVLEGAVQFWGDRLPGKLGLVLFGQHGDYHDQRHVMLGPAGDYRFEGMPPGQWKIRVSGGPFKYPWLPESEITVPSSGTHRKDLVVGVPSLHGTVRAKAGGEPLSGISVHLYGTNRYGKTDRTGSYSIPDLPAGDYRLTFKSDGYVKASVPVEGLLSETPRRVDVELERAAVVDVQFLDAAGDPVVGHARVSFDLVGQGVALSLSNATSADGRVRFARLRPGEYRIRGNVDELEEAETRATLVGGEEKKIVLRLERR